MSNVLHPRRVFPEHLVPVRATKIVGVEEVALEPPCFLEDLTPLLARIDARAQLGAKASVADLTWLVALENAPLRRCALTATRGVEQLPAVRGQRERREPGHEGRGRPLLHVITMERHTLLIRHGLGVGDDARRARGQGRVVPSRHVEREDALVDVCPVDADDRRWSAASSDARTRRVATRRL